MSKRAKAHEALVEQWTDVPEGTPVIVTKDDGQQFHTKTRSAPWMLCGTSVIMVEGIAGGYSLERVRLSAPPADGPDPECPNCGMTDLCMCDPENEQKETKP